MRIISFFDWRHTPKCGEGQADGFRSCFPGFSLLVFHPQVTGVIAIIVSTLVWSYSGIISLGVLCLWMGLFSFYLERKVLNRILVPPFTSVAVWGAIGCGIGIPLMIAGVPDSLSGSGIVDTGWAYMKVQLVYLVTFPVAWMCYYTGGFRKVKPITSVDGEQINRFISESKAWKLLAWGLFLGACFLYFAKLAGGSEDRGNYGPYGHLIPFDKFGPQIYWSVFPYFGLLGFIPAAWLLKESNVFGKSVICLCLLSYVGLAALTGSRMWMACAVVYLFIGSYLFRKRNSRYFEVALISCLLCGLGSVHVIQAYRNTSEFKSKPFSDVVGRARSLYKLFESSDAIFKDNSVLFGTGYSLFRYEDAKVYALSPSPVAYVGFSGFNAIVLTWIPTYFLRAKPTLLDMEWAAGSYRVPPVKIAGLQISLPADGYRRFGWLGVFISVMFYYLIYGMISRWFLNAWQNGALWGKSLLMFTTMFFWPMPFGTILTTWWVLSYNIPKHLILLALVCWVLSYIYNKNNITSIGNE